MKTIILLLFITISAQAQDAERIFDAINIARTGMSLPPLVYRMGEQIDLNDRVVQIAYKFELDDDCRCDYESIAGSKTLDGLIKKMTSMRYDWYHFADDAQYAAVAVTRANGLYYAVVRVYIE